MDNTSIKSTPKDVFLHLFNIVTFYLSVIGFITLYIQYINVLFPDKLNYYFTAIAQGVRWSTSVLFISIIAYVITSWMLEKDLKQHKEKRNLKLRKWLIYFTLFISAVTIIIDLMTFVYNFLDGELTTRFGLKVLVVLLVAAAVFGYYMWDLKRTDAKTNIPRILAIVVLVVSFGSIIVGFFIIGTPADQRERRFDEQRVGDLQQVQSMIGDYWIQKEKLPEQLVDLEDSISGFVVPTDPATDQVYEYIIVDELAFELCAVFTRSNDDDVSSNFREEYFGPMMYNENWDHNSGRVCFSRTIDPELYKDSDGEMLRPKPVMMR